MQRLLGGLALLAALLSGQALAQTGVIPTAPVAQPSSGNMVGSGCDPAQRHALWWLDQNACINADTIIFKSTDPSAGFTANFGGAITVGDRVRLTLTFGSGACAAGCNVDYVTQAGDTLASIGGGITCAIATNPNLFSLNGGSCSGGVVAPAAGANIGFGGYAGGAMIGYVVIIPNGVAFDFNSNVPLKVTTSVIGAGTETVTIANTNCAVRCSYPLDNNPNLQAWRLSGAAPQPGSVLWAFYSIGATSSCPTTVCVNYGNISMWVGNSTTGSTQAAWLLQSINAAGALAGGTWFGQGVYSNYGGAPFVGGTVDKGPGTFNAGLAYWLNNVHFIDNPSGQLRIVSGNGDVIIISSSSGVGINSAPSGNTFSSGLGSFVSGTQTPTAGQGISTIGGATPTMTARDYTMGAALPLNIAASALKFNGTQGLSTTKTLPAVGGGTCTMIFTGGLLTGGTC